MIISTSGASSFSRSISVLPENRGLRRRGLLPSTIFVMPLTRAYWAMAMAGSLPKMVVSLAPHLSASIRLSCTALPPSRAEVLSTCIAISSAPRARESADARPITSLLVGDADMHASMRSDSAFFPGIRSPPVQCGAGSCVGRVLPCAGTQNPSLPDDYTTSGIKRNVNVC